jgi:hypothetical protein
MDAWLERRFEELSTPARPAHRADVVGRKGAGHMERFVDKIERQAIDFNEELAGRLELDFMRMSPHSFSVRPSRERMIVLTADLAPSGGHLVLTTTRTGDAIQQFTLALEVAGEGDPVIRRGERDVRRMPSGNLERCLWLTLGTVFWPYCFWRYD